MPKFLAVLFPIAFFACAAVHPKPDAGPVYSADETQDAGTLDRGAPDAGPVGVIDIQDVDSDSLAPALDKYKEVLGDGQKDIWFRINSYGGSVGAGWDFIQAVEDGKKAHAGTKITCVVDTRAMSMGAVILESFCDKRLMTHRSVLLFHEGKTGLDGPLAVRELKSALDRLTALNASIAETIAKRLQMPVKDYRRKTDGLDWTLAYDEALAAHAVDGDIEPEDIPPPLELAPKRNPLLKIFGL